MKKASHNAPVAVRTVDISRTLIPIDNLSAYRSCRVYVFDDTRLLGMVEIENMRQTISPARLRDVIAEQLHWQLGKRWMGAHPYEPELSLIAGRIPGTAAEASSGLPASVSVSIALATFDRPQQLRECLKALCAQESPRRVEVVVVDNHPSSGLTPPVVKDFPGVVLVSEQRQGLAYARNAGFVRSSGDIIIATDDDVIMPPDWVEKLVAPFERSDVGVVTGNVLPRELETESQYLFEAYGGLGRGFEGKKVGPSWLRRSRRRAAPTWKLGATANAAFRAAVFRNPEIGLMDEALGPGMPSGVGEDTYLFYKIIKAGYSLVYQPDAYVWHTHRRDPAALRKQIYDYSKGHVSYHLTTLLRDRDRRALFRLLVELPRDYLRRIYRRLRGRSEYPVSLILLEIRGNLAGPWSLWKSRRRVRREGRSEFPTATGTGIPSAE
jgi:GT2 family glycosyltransferase